jgi:hypothetical protein
MKMCMAFFVDTLPLADVYHLFKRGCPMVILFLFLKHLNYIAFCAFPPGSLAYFLKNNLLSLRTYLYKSCNIPYNINNCSPSAPFTFEATTTKQLPSDYSLQR